MKGNGDRDRLLAAQRLRLLTPSGPPSPHKVSIAEVAAKAGVSIATVSRVVNGVAKKASGETIERVRQAVADLGYRPVNVGRALRNRQSRIVAILAANLANPAMSTIAASAEIALREAGFVMILCDTHDRADIQDEYLLELRAHLTSAIVMLGAVRSPQLDAFVAAGEHVLFVNRRYPGPKPTPFVGIENEAAGVSVADLMIERPIRDAAVIHGPITSSATMDRVSGFRRRCTDARIPCRLATAPGIDHLRIGYEAMGHLLASGAPDGLFCTSDLIAYGAQRRLNEAGVHLDRDGLIVGFDDNPLNDWLAPWLSSVRVPYDEFGASIVTALQAIWSGETTTTILDHSLTRR